VNAAAARRQMAPTRAVGDSEEEGVGVPG